MILDYYCHGYQTVELGGSRWDYFDLPTGHSALALISGNCEIECSAVNLFYWEKQLNKFSAFQV